jgi:hypothetical protein
LGGSARRALFPCRFDEQDFGTAWRIIRLRFSVLPRLSQTKGRTNDTIEIGGVINGLPSAHSDFLAAGDIGLLIGDGQLNYREEKILEGFYVLKSASLRS